ncbi:MAG TPA: branched-chain amino acid ABC transporter permease [Thermodesulfobacteriota bacterium]|nr:branched-chain amino acid ABC transporter permease [Thermodesulfobacteriota bacterium]
MTNRTPGTNPFAFLGLGAAAAALLILPPFLPPYMIILLSQTMIYAMAAASLDVLIGYANLGSLGHASYFAIGAFATAILETKLKAGFAVSLASGVGIAAAASALIGLLALRTSGIYFLLITLSIAMSIWGLIYRWASFTGGDNGISEIPRPDFRPWLDLSNHVHFYYFILFFFALCLVLVVLLVRSPFGKTLVGIRDSESRMKVLGYNVWLHKYLAFIIAGALAGLAGSVYAYFNKFVGPGEASLEQCMEFVLMVSIGGPGTLIGANVGALLITVIKNLVSVYTGRYLLILGIVYVLTAKYAPEGIVGLIRRAGARRK